MTIEALVRDFRGTVSPPIIYLRINEELSRPDPRPHVITEIIGEDAGLTARLLRLVNSSFFSVPQRIETVSEALRLVGHSQVRDLALVTTMMTSFREIPSDLVSMNEFWLHSLAVGVGARAVARSVGELNVERYFLAGVLHDIGRLVMLTGGGERMRQAILRAREGNMLLYGAELEEFGFAHTRVGEELLRSWGLPLYLQHAAGCHHAPLKSVHYVLEASVIHLADALAHALRYGGNGEQFVPPLSRGGWNHIGVSKLALTTIGMEVDRQVIALLDVLSHDAPHDSLSNIAHL